MKNFNLSSVLLITTVLYVISIRNYHAVAQPVLSFEKKITHDVMSYDGFARMLSPGPRNYSLVTGTAMVGATGDGETVVVKVDSSGTTLASLVMGKPDYHDVCLEILELNNSFYFVGYTRSIDTGASPLFTSFLIRTDINLQVLWQKNYIIPGHDLFFKSFSHAAETGEFIFCGNQVELANTEWNSFIMKTDTSGNVLWSKKYMMFLSFDATTIQELSNKDILVAGSVTLGFEQVMPTVLRFDSTGVNLWAKVFNYDLSTVQHSKFIYIRELPSGNLLLAGYSDYAGAANLGQSDLMVSRLDASGTIAWQKTFGGTQLDWLYGADFNPQQNTLTMLGTTGSYGGMSTLNGFYMSIDTGGNVANAFITGDTAAAASLALFNFAASSTPGYFISGADYSGNGSFYAARNSPVSSCHIMPVLPDTASAIYPELAYSVQPASQVILTNNLPFDYSTVISDTIICQQLSTGLPGYDPAENGLQIFPNPSNGIIRVSIDNKPSNAMTVSLYDITGKEIVSGIYTVNGTMNVTHLSPGFYFMRVAAVSGILHHGTFIVE